MHQQPGAVDHDGHGFGEVLRVVENAARSEKAGVVDEDVHRPGLLHRAADAAGIGYIQFDSDRADPASGFRTGSSVAGAQEDLVAPFHQPLGDGKADAAIGSGHEGALHGLGLTRHPAGACG